jgi:hypothetical protein
MGKQYSLLSGDIKYIVVTLQGQTKLGAFIEVGRGKISSASLQDALASRADLWVPMIHTATQQRMAHILLNAQLVNVVR